MRPHPGIYARNDALKVYEGKVTVRKNTVVTVNGSPLPTGLTWGYGGSGPAQLAIALLCDAFGPQIAGKYSWVLDDFVRTTLKQHQPWVVTEHELYLEFMNLRADKPSPRTRTAFEAIEVFFKKPK
jgi:hypothetical protein